VACRKDWGSNYSWEANQVHLARIQLVQHLVDLEVFHNGPFEINLTLIHQQVEASKEVHHVVD